jgi:hypothetical protein
MAKTIWNLWAWMLLLVLSGKMEAQLSGNYNVPSSYTSVAAAIADLNLQGVSGPVFINIAAGYTETAPVGGYSLTATGTAANPITFRKTGVGSNPLISAYTGGTGTPGSAVQDGVWRLIGCDYITIDGISITDPNVSNPATMEYGIGLFKANTGDGCQNNTIQNCVITLNIINNAAGTAPATDGSRAINVVNSLPTSQTTVLTPTAASGANSNNKFYSNTIQNCNIGIALIGYAAPSPFTLADNGNDVGGSAPATGNSILNFGGASGATNPAAGIRTLAQYDINVSNNTFNNNNGGGANHVSVLRGVYLNTATSANAIVSNNTITINSAATTAQASAIENASGATSSNNTITITGNLISNSNYTSNTSSSFIGIYNNAASSTYLNISANTFTAIDTRATTGTNYLIYNTGAVTGSITFTNNLISGCTNSASTSGVYFGIYNNAVSSAVLNMSNNTFTNVISYASTGATQFIYNSSATSNSITISNNTVGSCSTTVTGNGPFYGIFNNGATTANLDMSGNSYLSHTVTAASGAVHLIYNTAAATNSIILNSNFISNCTTSITSTGIYYGIYNNAGSSGFLQMNNNTFNGNFCSATTASVHLIFNRGVATNTFVAASLDNNLITNHTFSASTAPFMAIYNAAVTCTNLSMSSNTVSNGTWQSTGSPRYLVYNTGAVNTTFNCNNNFISNCSNTVNTTGTFNGLLNTGSCTVALNISGNTFTNYVNRSSTGGTYLIFNSGAVAGGAITMTNNLLSAVSNSASGSGDFYGIHNLGTTFNSVDLSNNTVTSSTLSSFTGATNLVYNTGAVSTSISNINLNNNLVSACTASIGSSGSFFGIYNNACSGASLSLSNNTFTNSTFYAVNGAVHSVYNRGSTTNTFALVRMENNLISSSTNSASSNASFYGIWNNGVTSTVTSVSNNTVTNSSWATTTSLRYMISNAGISPVSIDMTNNLISNCINTLNTTGILYGIYNTASSSGTLRISNNTITGNNSAATSGDANLIINAGAVSNSVALSDNFISNCSYTASTTGSYYHIYNNAASSASLEMSRNTFTNNSSNSSTGNVHLVYNRGVATNTFINVLMTNNLVAAYTHSASGGNFFAIYSNGVTSSYLSITNNTCTNNTALTTATGLFLLYNQGPVTNSTSISDNLVTNWSNTLTTTPNFFVINNSGNSSAGDLAIHNNVLSNINTVSTTGNRYLIYNSGAITNSTSIKNNLITACNQTISSTGSYYGINNNSSGSGLDLNISNNQVTGNYSSLINGSTFLFINSGAVTTTISNVTFSNNTVSNYTSSPTSGQFYGIFNTGMTSANLSIGSNTLTDIVSLATTSARQLIYNNGRITSNITMINNHMINYSSPLNTTGTFISMGNGLSSAPGNFPASLTVSNNRFQNIQVSASSGAVYVINNSGVVGNTLTSMNVNNNLCTSFSPTVTSGNIYGIYNAAVTSTNLSASSNTFVNTVFTSTTSTRYMIYNGVNIIGSGSASISSNFISNVTSTLNTTGVYYGINNGGNSLGDLIITNNILSDHVMSSSSGSLLMMYNTGTISNSITVSGNLASNISHSAISSGGFHGVYNNAASSANLYVSSNTFTSINLSTANGTSQFIYNRGVASNTITSLSIINNTVSGSSYSATTGAFYGIYNSGTTTNTLVITGNVFDGLVSTGTASPRYFFNNSGGGASATSLMSINNNLVSNYTASLNTTGSFYNVMNSGASTGSLDISNNTFTNQTLPATTGTSYAIYNNGNVANTTITGNMIAAFSYTSTSGYFYGISNNNISAPSINITIASNTLNNVVPTNSTSPKYMISNTTGASGSISIINNLISNYTGTLNTTGNFYGIYHFTSSTGNISMDGNSFNNVDLASTTGTAYMVYNAGPVNGSNSLSNNLISNYGYSTSGTGVFYGVYNLATNCSGISMTGNTFSNAAISTPSTDVYMVYNVSSSGSNSTTTLSMDNNAVRNFTHTSSSGSFYGVHNNAMKSTSLSISGNTFSNCISTASASARYFVYNTGSVTGVMNFNNNTLSAYNASLNATGPFYGVFNTAGSLGDINMNGNSFLNTINDASTANSYFVYNAGQATNTIGINGNAISGTSNSITTSGSFYGIYNSGSATGLSISNSTLSNNTSAATTADTYLMYNTGVISNSIIINGNILGYGFTNNTVDYSGILYSIYNAGGATTTSLNIAGNNFINYPFSGVSGSGIIYFIRNTNDNSIFNVSGNTWTNLSLNHNNSEILIYNPSSTQNSLSVVNNSIVGGYTRTGTAGSMFLYYSNANSPGSCSQTFSGNNFSNITANTQGTGAFYGIYSLDGISSPYPKKQAFNNIISNVSYNGVGFFYGYYFDFLGDGSTLAGSAIHDNTLSAISWAGPMYGIYIGNSGSPTYGVKVYSNTMSNLSSSAATADMYGTYLLNAGSGIDFYKNKISDISSNGVLGTANGIYIQGATNTKLFNNLVGNIFTPSSSATNPLNGIDIAGGSQVSAYYNTVYLNAVSSSSAFSSNAISAASSVSLELRNNIFINTSTPNGNGVTLAYRRSSSSLSNYSANSNNNVFYVGIPVGARHVYHDGNSFYSTLPAYQALVTPRESASVFENTPFLSTVGTNNNFLHVNPSIPSLTESGAVNIAGITDDVDSQVRQGNTGYSGTGTAPDIGADEYNQNLNPCSSANAGTVVIPASNTVCAGQSLYMLSTGYTGAGSIVHQWKVSTTQGGPYTNVSGGNGANYVAYSTGSLSQGTFYYVMVSTCTLNSSTGISNEVTVSVNPVPSANAAASSQTLCSGQNFTLSATSNIGTNFNWRGPNNFTSTAQNPVVNNAISNSSGVYTLVVSNSNCAASPVFVNATVAATPPSFSLSPPAASLCVGASQTIAASIPLTTPTLNVGSQGALNGASGYPAPYSVYYGGQKMQTMVLANELTAAGFTGGSQISSLEFSVVSMGSNWGGSLQQLQNFMISAKATTVSQLSSFETGLSLVYGPLNYTPAVGTNIHNFASPFTWDGSSNVVLETVFSNSIVGSAGNAVFGYSSPTGFQSTLIYRADNQSVATIAAASNTNANVGFVRPDFKLKAQPAGSYSWSPSAGLSSATAPTVAANPVVNTVYTASLINNGCLSSASMALNVILVPTVNIASTANTVCVGNSATLTATGASNYTWSTAQTSSMVVVSPFITSNYSVTGSNPACPNATAGITLISSPALTIVTQAAPAAVCLGGGSTLTAAGATTYTWTGGSTGSTLAVSPTISTNYNVIGYMGPGCWANKFTQVKVNSLPVISVQPNADTLCAGEFGAYEAAGVFNYTWTPGNVTTPVLMITPTISMVYTVTGADQNGCTGTATLNLMINPCLGISDKGELEKGVSIYPNPSNGKFVVQFSIEAKRALIVRNAIGQTIIEINNSGVKQDLELSNYRKGIYTLTVVTENSSSNYKLIVE